MPKISVVVPIYNVEKYLRECLDSIINQTFKDIEIILVDDGSPDNCPQICDEYAEKDERVKVIHKSNGGYGSAVNLGIEKATGEYIGIIESDDWIEPDMYEKLYKNAKENDTDITKCAFYYYNSYLPKFQQNRLQILNNRTILDSPSGVFKINDYPFLVVFHSSVWAGIYKSEFIKQQKFIEKGSYQDMPFTYEAFCRAQKISVVPKAFVHYRQEPKQKSSMMSKGNSLNDALAKYNFAKELLKKYDKYEKLKNEYWAHVVRAGLFYYAQIDKKYKHEFFNNFRNLLTDLENVSENPYLDDEQKRLINHIKAGHFYKSLSIGKKFKREVKRIAKQIFSVTKETNNKKNSHTIIQILGIKIKYPNKNIFTRMSNMEKEIDNIQNLIIWSTAAEKIPQSQGPFREYQKANANFLKFCTDIFEKHNLPYWLFAGTLLGSVRCKDFIPWDDDIDTGMLRKDYDKLSDILDEEFKNNPNLYYTKGDIIKILYKDLPIQVDVFAFDIYPQYLSDNSKIRELKNKMAKCHNEIKFDYSKIFTGNCIVNKTYEELAQMRKKIYDVVPTEKKMIVEGFEYAPAHDGFMVLDYDWVFPLKKSEFAGFTFTIPNHPDLFLYEHYGDYTRLPQKIHSHFQLTTMDIARIRKFNQDFNEEKIK